MSKAILCFFDANVWFTAARSKTGGSFLLMQLAEVGVIKVYASDHVLEEAERNLLLKSSQHVAELHALLAKVKPTLVRPTLVDNIAGTAQISIPLADIQVLSEARQAQAMYLVSLDKRHIVNQKTKSLDWSFQIVLPGELLAIIADVHS